MAKFLLRSSSVVAVPRLLRTPNGQYAYVANYGSSPVSVIKASDNTLTGTPSPAVVGKPYNYAFAVTGQPTPTVTVAPGSTLPDGLTLIHSGSITGTPTTSRRFEFIIIATNGIGEPVTLPATWRSPSHRPPDHSDPSAASDPDLIIAPGVAGV